MSLSTEIQNLPTNLMDPYMHQTSERVYKIGHRDARHQAVEVALKYEGLIKKLFDALRDRHADELVYELREEYNL